MRLIDADKLNFEKQIYSKSQFDAILDFIDKQPTAYDVEKVVAEMGNLCGDPMYNGAEEQWHIDRAIDIVRNGGKE